MKQITIAISDEHYDAIRDAAHARGSTVTQVAVSAVVAVARSSQRPLARLVGEYHAEGLSVSEIAANLGVTNIRVKETLRRLHIPPNPPKSTAKPYNPRSRS